MQTPGTIHDPQESSGACVQPDDGARDPASSGESNDNSNQITKNASKRGFRFWAVIVSLGTMSLLASLENTVVATSLPTIVRDLHVGDNYIWVTNVIFLTK